MVSRFAPFSFCQDVLHIDDKHEQDIMAYTLTRDALLLDLYAAYHMAKRHKASKHYVKVFERRLDDNLRELCDDLYDHHYEPEPSSCFIVERPKKREVFAAQFRDRVVHHLYYNYTHQIFDRTFIEDSYSCIQGRGTHYGIERLKKHILQESQNYSRKCYAMSLDIRGYFMHIDRQILLDITTNQLRKMAGHHVSVCSPVKWGDILDIDFLCWLSGEIIMLNPKTSCKIVGRESDWIGLDKNKSLFHTPEGCGLPIGNLTSQLLSNVYLNEFDQFMKRNLKCQHYGRYVDDSYIVSCDREWLKSLVPDIRKFLQERLHLDIHLGKTQIHDVEYGVEFLGGFVKPYRTYISNHALRRMRYNVRHLPKNNPDKLFRSVNAFLGVLSHHNTFKLRNELFCNELTAKYGYFNSDMTMYMLHDR